MFFYRIHEKTRKNILLADDYSVWVHYDLLFRVL